MTKYNFEPQKVDLHRKRFMSFKEFMASGAHLRFKNRDKDKYAMSNAKPLRETIGNFQNEIDQTMLAAVPQNVEDRQRLLNYVNSQLRKMAESMDIVVTVIGLEPAQDGD